MTRDNDDMQQGKGPPRHETKDRRRFKVNDDFFEKIDTPSKAYILGLIASDGNLRKDMPSVRLRMLKDDELFGKIKKELDSDRPIKDYMNKKGHKMSTLEVYSKKLHEDLQKKGLKPGAKSTDLRFPDTSRLPGSLQRDFIRGVFDGDGSVSQFARLRGDKGYDFAIVGNKQFLEKVKEIMEKDCKVNKVNLTRDQRTVGTYRLRYGGPKNMGKIFEYLYGKNGTPDHQICMRRKYEKMKEAYDYYKDSLNEKRIIDAEKLSYDMTKAVKEEPLTISDLAYRLNHKRSTIKKYGSLDPNLELVYPDGKNCVFKIKGQELKNQVYPENYRNKILEKYLKQSQINAFKQFASAGLYDYEVKRSYADVGKKIGLSADNVKHQATRIKERLLAIPKDELL